MRHQLPQCSVPLGGRFARKASRTGGGTCRAVYSQWLSKQGFTIRMLPKAPQIATEDPVSGLPAPAAADAARTAVRNETMGTEDAGQRVDKVLSRLLPGVPHTRIFRLLRKGEVRLNGKRVAGEARVAEGDVLRVPPVRLNAPAAPGGAVARSKAAV